MAPHTPNLAFSFLACACALLGVASHTLNLAFSFLACPCALLGVAPHTLNLAFSFLACACALLGGACALLGWLRTRQILLFLFWRMHVPCWSCSAHVKSCFFFSGVCLCPVGVAPHTPNLAFSFLAYACALLGGLRTR